MIKNHRQLTIAEGKAHALEQDLAEEGDSLNREVILELLADIRDEIGEYRDIVGGLENEFALSDLDSLSDALVKARLSRGLTQKELADRLGVREQMVQRDEAGGYERASLERLIDVAEALEYELEGELRPREKVLVSWRTTPSEPLTRSFNFSSERTSDVLLPVLSRTVTDWDLRQEEGSHLVVGAPMKMGVVH